MAPTNPKNFPLSIAFTALLILTSTITHVPVFAQGSSSSSVSCSDAINTLVPCGTYLLGASEVPDERCCGSAQALKRMASTKILRSSLCKCLEDSGPSFGVQPERAKGLLSLCKLGLNIPVSPNYNCDLIP